MEMPIRALAVALSAFVTLTSEAHAQQQSSPCASAEFHQMDFWLGSWDARWEASPNMPAGAGTNVVTRDFGGCVIHEHFDGAGMHGESWSLYQARAGMWRQTWVDDQGGYFALRGGADGDDFVLTVYSIANNAPVQRMVFEDIAPASFTWRWQSSPDAGGTWTDAWVIHYVRRAD